MPLTRIAVVSCLLLLGVCALGSPAGATGDEWGEPTRTCSDGQFFGLLESLELQCGRREDMGCLDLVGCFNLRRMHQRLAACKGAVDAVNFTCYAGSYVQYTAESLSLEVQMEFCRERIAMRAPIGCGRPCPF